MALNWDDFRYLLALRQAGSLGAAARALKVDHSTMGRRLAALETALGVQLVSRTPEGIQLNQAGALASDAAEGMQRIISELSQRVGGADANPTGTVRVSVTDGFASLLSQGLAHLRAEHPGICVELVIKSGAVDLSRHEADIAVRLFREAKPDLITRKVGEIGWSVYAAHSYIERKGFPNLSDLRGHDIVGFADEAARSPGGRWLASRADAETVVMRGTTVVSVMNGVKAGMGVSLLPCSWSRRSRHYAGSPRAS